MLRPVKTTDLAVFSIFSGLPEAAITELRLAAEECHWTAGEVMFLRGDEESYLLALISGRVRISLSSPQGRELVLRHVGPGETFGELALIDGLPRSADATAVEATTALILRRTRFLALCAEHADLPLAVARYLCAHLRNTNHQMESIALYDLQSRLVRFLLLTLRQLHGDKLQTYMPLKLGLNQNDLAAVLGASRPKVNQTLQTLISTGALRREGALFICNCDLLQKLIDDFDAQ